MVHCSNGAGVTIRVTYRYSASVSSDVIALYKCYFIIIDYYCVCANIRQSRNLCSNCPPCAQMRPRRCGCHCLIASSMKPGGNVSTLRWGTTSADWHHESGCGTHTAAASHKCHRVATYHFSCLNTLIKMWSSVENVMFIVYINSFTWIASTQHQLWTTDCSKWHCIGNRDILSSIFKDE